MSPRRALPALLAMLTAAVMAIWSLVPGSGSTAVVGAAVSPPAAAPREVRLPPAIERLPVELSRSRADAAGIEGRTFACRGRIWERGEHGPPGVRVELGVVTAEEALVLAEVTSGPRGRFEGGLAVPGDLAERKDARLFARVALEGHPRRLWRAPLPETGREAVFHLSLVLQNLLAGRVVDSAGRPVRDASVELRTDGRRGLDASARTDADGAFVLAWARPGTYRLHAKAPGRGSAEVHPVFLSGDSGGDEIEVVLSRAEALAGRVLDTEGRPLEGVELWAFPSALAGRAEEDLFRWRLTADAQPPEGLRSQVSQSTEDGRFRFSGLAPGAYFVAPVDGLGPETFGAQVGRRGDEEIVIVLERWWLEVRAPPFGEAFCAGLYGGRAGRRLETARAGEETRSHVFSVCGGRSYLVGWIDAGHEVVEEAVFIPWDRPRTVCEITAGRRVEPGILEVAMLSLGRADDRRGRTVSVHSGASGVKLWEWKQGAEAVKRALPPGSHVLRVVLDRTHSYHDGFPGFENLHVAETAVEIEPGTTSRLELWR